MGYAEQSESTPRLLKQIEELKAQLDHQDKHFSDLNLLIDRKNKQLTKAIEVIKIILSEDYIDINTAKDAREFLESIK
jgi:CHASE3 domain sensor protein